MVFLNWYGQACFEISDSSTVVTDPHDGDSIGLGAPQLEADVVTISHDHYDHSSGVELVSKAGTVTVDGLGEEVVDGVDIRGFESYHDKSEGEERGKNLIFTIDLDGVRICHLGDLGHTLDSEGIERLGDVDVLLTPVGGNFTIDGSEAAEITEEIDPQVVVPMHYKINGLQVPISGSEEFLDSLDEEYDLEERDGLRLKALPGEKKVVKLACKV
ncbi:hypothetical protein AKJ42_00620 [candidate division MSBL1 archaeon SCGC-AAA261C02]|uniref:Zn-dependent hydrolase n=1 Tax=candidate division MSBL1 archaeon SCGC-AAA261C02 TaxID=1698272 RepID=A0A133V1W6_9EURY|nr:hypothetical protein AKJ42_00620 [candidate division MSBL1 archaeon SCGC-AAA261C02]